MRIDILTLFPEMFEPILGTPAFWESKGKKGILTINPINIRSLLRINIGRRMIIPMVEAPEWLCLRSPF